MKDCATLVLATMADLELALMEDDVEAVQAFVDEIDRKTANEAFIRMGEHFCFPTVEIDGVVRGSAAHISTLLGYKKTHALTELLARWGIYGIKAGGFTYDTYSQLKQALGLNENDNSAILLPYSAILIAGMYSTNKEARPIKAYLLKCERLARTGNSLSGGDARARALLLRIKMEEKIIGLLDKVRSMPNGEYKNAAIERLETFTGKKFTRTIQGEIDFTKKGNIT